MNDERYMELLRELQEKVLKLQAEIDGLKDETDKASSGTSAVDDLKTSSQKLTDILRLVQERQGGK